MLRTTGEVYKSKKDPKKESNKPEEDNRLIELADEELDSVTGGNDYEDDHVLTIDGMDQKVPDTTSSDNYVDCGEPQIPDGKLHLNPW